jgi:dihydrofolate synthase / folylpolyglutamate synthase
VLSVVESSAQQSRYAEVVAQLTGRWPESRIEPSLARITALLDLLGDPQQAYPVITVTGTNGKSSTARMIASLLRALGLRTGLHTSPHLLEPTERIEIDGEPIAPAEFVRTWEDIAPFAEMVDTQSAAEGGVPLSFFEIVTAMAYAAFADAPVDVAVVEVGMGGTWDATSVAQAQVAVILPVDLDHTEYLGATVAAIASEKAGIITPGAAAVIGRQRPEAAEVIARRVDEMSASAVWEGRQFDLARRDIAVGGQVITVDGIAVVYAEVFVPAFGEHQGHNAACALVAVESFLGGKAVPEEVVEEGFASLGTPGRLEIVRTGPTVLVDAAHNPAGARALAAALVESFAFTHIVACVSVLEDKDVLGILVALEGAVDEIVVTQNASPRAMNVDALAALAVEVFGSERVAVGRSFVDAVDTAIGLAEEADSYGAAGVIVTGSVVTAGQARGLLLRERRVIREEAEE